MDNERSRQVVHSFVNLRLCLYQESTDRESQKVLFIIHSFSSAFIVSTLRTRLPYSLIVPRRQSVPPCPVGKALLPRSFRKIDSP